MKKKRSWTLQDMFGVDADTMMTESEKLHEACCKIITGTHPTVVGVVLAKLVATWLFGHIPTARSQMFQTHVEAVRLLLEFRVNQTEGGKN
jgi:hypothetical protein